MADDTNITPRSGDPKLARDRLRVIRGGGAPAEVITVAAAPADSMRGLDFETMLLNGSEPASDPAPEPIAAATGQPEISEPQPASAMAPEIDSARTVGDLGDPSGLDDFQLSYADGSTTPAPRPRRSLVPRRSRGREEPVDQARLAQALEDTSADVWAAHRDESWPTDCADSLGSPAEPFATEPQPRRVGGSSRGLAVLALIALLVVALGAGAFVALNGGGTRKPSVAHKSRTPRVTQTVAQALTTPAATTPAKPVKKHHKQRVMHHHKATHQVANTTTTTTTVTPVTPAVKQTTAPVADTTSTGAAKSTTPAKTTPAKTTPVKTTPVKTTPVRTTTSSTRSTPTNNESPGGALPGVQQTQQAP